jgi:hypothetical protein
MDILPPILTTQDCILFHLKWMFRLCSCFDLQLDTLVVQVTSIERRM